MVLVAMSAQMLMEQVMSKWNYQINLKAITSFFLYSCETLNSTKRNEEFYKPTCMAGRKKWLGM